MNEEQEPMERLEEFLVHPADKTFTTYHDKSLSAKKELKDERHELGVLLSKLPSKPPKPSSKEYAAYTHTLTQIQILKSKISKKHDELMELLKNEEKTSREIQDRKNSS